MPKGQIHDRRVIVSIKRDHFTSVSLTTYSLFSHIEYVRCSHFFRQPNLAKPYTFKNQTNAISNSAAKIMPTEISMLRILGIRASIVWHCHGLI